jgi:iron(III) transport system substrate-binding protein
MGPADHDGPRAFRRRRIMPKHHRQRNVERRRAGRFAPELCAAAFMLGLFGASAAAQTAPDILLYSGADREQKLIDGAKQEGQVVLYSAMIVNQALRPLTEAFETKYPFLKLTYWRADSEEIIAKLNAEIRADNLVADVVESAGVGELVEQSHLGDRFSSPMFAELPQKYLSPDGVWAATRLNYFSIAYNTNLVAAESVPKTYDALLDPQWTGKIAWRIASPTGTELFLTNLRLAWGEEKAMDYFRRLAAQKIVNFGSGSARTLVDRVIAGEYPIALNIFAHHPLISRAKGASVNSQLMDPEPSVATMMIVPKGVHHPYAAMLLADFILSSEGQQILANAAYFPVRSDVSVKPLLEPVVPSLAHVPENFIPPKEFNQYDQSSEKIFEDLFR